MAHAACTHPVLNPADMAGMLAHELLYFTDTPVAHVAAFRDFQRDLAIEARNRETLRIIAARGR